MLSKMLILRILAVAAVFGPMAAVCGQDDLDRALVPKPAAEQTVLGAMKSADLAVIHLWAPWCPNCQAQLTSGGRLKNVKANPADKFYCVTVWNDGGDGKAMLQRFQIADQPNVTILSDPGPRRGNNKIKRFAGMPVSWCPSTWVYKDGDLRYALNYGEVRFDVLQQFLEDSKSEWSHKGEPKLPE
jgi:thiol-disulfide isomerase/thioredoxin